MKGKISLLTRKIFALIVAISMSIPPTAFANAPEPVVYDANSSIMGLAPTREEETKVENTDQSKVTKDIGDYSLEITSKLDQSLTKIDYTIKAKRKDQSKNENLDQAGDKNLSLTIAKTPTSNIKDIKLISASAEIEETPEIKDDLKSLILTSKANDEIIYNLSADVNKATDGRSYELIIGLKDNNKANVFAYSLKTETGIRLVDNEEVQTIELIHKDEKLSKAKGDYKKEGILGGLFASYDTITWTDYLVNDQEDNKELTYDFNLDQNQISENSQIAVDYYDQSSNGFVIKKEFSQKIDFAKKVKFEIPAGFIAKLSLQTKVSKKNTNVKEYSLNKSVLKNPIYIEGNKEEKSDDEEDPAPADKNQKPAEEKPSTEIKVDDKASEEKQAGNKTSDKEEKTSDTQITVTDSSGNEIPVIEKKADDKVQISAITLNKDSLIASLEKEGKLTADLKTVIEDLAQNLESYNEEKISDQELKDFTKAQATNNNIEKSDLRFYLESILSGLNKQKNKAANLNYDEIINYAYPEKKEPEIKVNDQTSEKEGQKEENSSEKPSTQIKADDKAAEEKTSEKQESTDKKENETNENKGLMQNLSAGLKSLFSNNTSSKDLSNYEKADKELKAAIESGKSLEEIQNLLYSLEEKYGLSQDDQEKLMTSNNEAILDLVEKHRKGNTFLNFFRANESDPLYRKHFTVKTFFQTNTTLGPIAVGQYFKIKLDKKLTVNPANRPLDPIKDPNTGEVIAEGQYLPTENAIWYKVVKPIRDNLNLPLNIDVEYNIDEIRKTIPSTQGFEVENFVSGFGVVNPRSLGKFTVNANGEITGNTIDEGNHKDVTQIFEYGSNYRVELKANSSPVVENGKLTAIDWTVNFFSDHDLNDPTIDLRTNFTIVDGSGFDKIEQVYLNGEAITTEDNTMGDKFLIKDSKYHKADRPSKTYTYTFRTKVTQPQSVYTLDIAALLYGKKKKGAVRLVGQGYPEAMLQDLTPNRTSANNRTTIKGEFVSDTKMVWKITDEVSTGDDGSLPLATRKLDNNQTRITSDYIKTASYGLDTEGRMEQKSKNYFLTKMPEAGTSPASKQDYGTIAVYQIRSARSLDATSNTYSLGGVDISLYQDLAARMKWMLPSGPTPPKSTITTKTGTSTASPVDVTVGQNSEGAYEKDFTIPEVKVWNIANNGTADKLTPTFTQTFTPPSQAVGNTTYNFVEKEIYYDIHDKKYIISNTANENNPGKPGFITILKTDKDDNKPLAGAVFSLSGTGGKRENITTGADGRVKVSNVMPGTYTLIETKAPVGYRINPNPTVVRVNSQGEVNKTEDIPTKYLEANGGKPGFMNTYDYAKISKDRKTIDYYIYLKPKSDDPQGYNSTDRDTRLFLNMTGASFTATDIYDVSPDDRARVKKAMEDQNVDTIISGLNSVKNVPNQQQGTITQTYGIDSYVDNQYNEGQGYIFKIPQKRITNNWGFLVKVSANITSGATSVNPRFYWLCDFFDVNDVKDNWKIERRDLNVMIGQDDNPENLFTFTNEKFPSQDVRLDKVDRNGKPIKGVEFTLLTKDGHQVAKQVSDDKGQINFGKVSPGEYDLYETQAPEGYFKTPIHFKVKVSEGGLVTFEGVDKDNEHVDPGTRYWIDQVQINDPGLLKPKVTVTDTSINLREKGTGKRPGVWEGFEFETFDFKTHINMTSVIPGQTLDIKLDSRWDLSRLLNDQLPEIKDKTSGDVIAKPYLDKKTNLITYIFNEKAASASVDMDLNIVGLYPSPYFVRNNNETVTFTNVVNASGENPYTFTNTFTSYYGEYLTHGTAGLQTYPGIKNAITDTIVNADNSLSSRAIFYYNPLAEKNDLGTNKINIDWESVDQGTSDDVSIRNRFGKPMELRRVRVYRVDRLEAMRPGGKKTHEKLMPQSMGVRPSEDPSNYTLIADFNIGNNRTHRSEQSNVYLDYNFNRRYSGRIYNQSEQSAPLNIQLPRITQREGYIIETDFDVTNKRLYEDYYRQLTMEIVASGEGRVSRIFTQKSGSVTGESEQTEIEIPKIYTQILKVINESYKPGKFELTKIDQVTRKTIDGVSFILSDIYGNTTVKKTDINGKIYFDRLRPGSYTLQEGQPKEGYVFTDKKWSIDVDTAGNTVIRRVGFDDEEVIEDGKLLVENKPKGLGFKLYKQGEKGEALGGAKFKLTKDVATKPSQEKVSDPTTGEVSFENMTEGTFYLEEIEPPSGYNKLDKKYKIVIGKDGKAQIYLVKDNQGSTTTEKFGLMKDMKTVDVMSRATTTWRKDSFNKDERYYDYAYSSDVPNELGTRIIGIDKTNKTFVQRFVINPEANTINQQVIAFIRRDRAGINENTNWYNGDGTLKSNYINIYTLDKPVTGKVADIVVNDQTATNVTKIFHGTIDNSTVPNRLKLSLLEDGVDPKNLTGDDLAAYKSKLDQLTNKPIIVDVKTSYNDNNGEIGLGMYSQLNGWWAFKRDFYETANDVVEAKEEGNISFDYVGENTLFLKNERTKTKFRLKKISDSNKLIEGAVFSLEGKDSNTIPYPKQEAITGKDGTLTFDGLTVGDYILKEVHPAPGYESQGEGKYWVLKVTEDSTSPGDYKMELVDQDGHGPTPPPQPPKPGTDKVSLSGSPKTLKAQDLSQDTGIIIKNRKNETSFLIVDEDPEYLQPEFRSNPDGSESIWINPKASVDGPISLTIQDDDLKSTNPEGKVTYTIDIEGHKKGVDDNKSNKLEIDSTNQHFIDPKQEKQGTGIILKNTYRKYSIEAKDEDGINVGYEVNAQTGEIELTPPANVDGPISLTVTSPDLPGSSWKTSVGVNGHRPDTDDNESDLVKILGTANSLPVNGTNYWNTGFYLSKSDPNARITKVVDDAGRVYPSNYYYIDDQRRVMVCPGTNVDGPIYMTIESPNIKGGSQVLTVPIVNHEAGRDDYPDDNTYLNRYDVYTLPADGNMYPSGYQIVSPTNDIINPNGTYKIKVTDAAGNNLNYSVGVDNYNRQNVIFIQTTNTMTGPIKISVDTRSHKKDYYLDVLGSKSYHLEKVENRTTLNHPDWGARFMNYKTSVIGGSTTDGDLTTRIFLNPDTGIRTGQDGRGPDNVTKLTLEKNAATFFEVKVYWVRSNKKSQYMNDTSVPGTDLRNFIELKNGNYPAGLGGPLQIVDAGSSYEITFPISNAGDKRWEGHGYIVEIKATYPDDSFNTSKAAPPKLINYEWKSTSSGAFIDGDVGFRKVEDTTRSRSARLFSARSMDTRASLLANNSTNLASIPYKDMSQGLSLAKDSLEMSEPIKPQAQQAGEDRLDISEPVQAQAQQAGEDRSPGTPRAAFSFDFDATKKEATIVNRQVGIQLKVNKREKEGRPLPNAIFKLTRKQSIDENGKYVNDEKVIFEGRSTDSNGNIISDSLLPGRYELEETAAPEGYVVPPAPWIIEVKEENGRLQIYQRPPGMTPQAYIDANTAATVRPANHSKIFSYKLVAIDTERRTFTIRMYINPEGIPNNREYSFDFFPKNFVFADEAEKGAKGVMFNYRTTYRITNPKLYEKKELNLLNLKSDDVELINTARFRPFRYGFTQDLINLKNISQNGGEAVGYVIDLDGSYTEGFFNKDNNQLDIDFWFGEIQKGKFEKGKTSWRNWGEVENIAGTDGTDQYVVKPFKEELVDGQWKQYNNPPEDKIYHMNFNLSKLFTSDQVLPVGDDGLTIYNRDETYNMAFTKYDGEHHDIDVEGTKDKLVRLEGAVFQLQRKELGVYRDIQGYALATAFNGFVGFNNLPPGEYRIIELKPPRRKVTVTENGQTVEKYINYRKIEGPVMDFTLKAGSRTVTLDGKTYTRKGDFIITKRHPRYIPTSEVLPSGSGLVDPNEKIVTNPEHEIPDYVTHATQQFGKVLNDEAGLGKIEVNKTGDDGKPLKGATFKVTRISSLGKENTTAVSDQITSDANGFIKFENLPIGNYILEEVSAPDGYEVDRQVRRFTVGGKGNDPYYEVPTPTGNDLTKYITYDDQKIYHINDLTKEIGGPSISQPKGKIDPNNSESLVFVNKFSINKQQMITDKVGIKAGDQFTIHLSDNLDLNGIDTRDQDDLNIIEEGVGTIAHAKYDKATNTITYLFTDFAKFYSLDSFTSTINAYINNKVVKTSSVQKVSMDLNNTNKGKWITVDYSLIRGHTEYGYENLDISTKIVKYNPDTGEFTQYIYVNRDNDSYSNGATFQYEPGKALSDVKIETYPFGAGQVKSTRLPVSFGVDEAWFEANIENKKTVNVGSMGAGAVKDINLGGPLGNYDAFFIKVTGKVLNDTGNFKPTAWVYNTQYPKIYANTWSWARFEKNIAGAKIDFSVAMPNRKNRLKFEKVDQFNNPVPSAGFKLYKITTKENGKPTGYTAYTGSPNTFTSNQDGSFEIIGLPQGDYGLKEEIVPDGYTKVDEWAATFTVDRNGYFTDIKTNYHTDSQQGPVKGENIDDSGNVQRVINDKEFKYKFKKVDNKTQEGIGGAEFELLYRPKEYTVTTDINGNVIRKDEVPWENVRVTQQGSQVNYKVPSGADGLVEFKFKKPGYYQIKEVKAPDGYIQPENGGTVIKEFVLVDGKIKIKTKVRPGLLAKDASSTDKDSSIMLMTKKDQSGFKYLDTTVEINPTYKTMTFTKDAKLKVNYNANVGPNTIGVKEAYLVGKGEEPSTANKVAFGDPIWENNLGMALDIYKYFGGQNNQNVTTDKKLIIKYTNIDLTKDQNGDLQITTTLEGIQGASENPVATYKFKSSDIPTRKEADDPNYSILVDYEEPNAENSNLAKVENIKKLEYKFQKVDSSDKSALQGAEFKLYYKQTKTADYEELDSTKTYTSGSDGIVNITDLYKDGYYAIKETKAPVGYQLPTGKDGFVKDFKIDNGTVYVLGKSNGKGEIVNGAKGWLSSQTISTNANAKTFTQRIIINPNHKLLNQDFDTKFNIVSDGWSITNKTSTGVKVKAAVLPQGKEISQLTDSDYYDIESWRVFSPDSSGKYRSSFNLRALLRDTAASSNVRINTTNAVVVEFEGKLDANKNPPVNINSYIKFDINDPLDNVEYTMKNFMDGLTYQEYSEPKSDNSDIAKVENKKGEYPLTASVGTAIFTAIGLAFMVMAAFIYKRKRTVA